MVIFKYPYLFNHMELEGGFFCSQDKFRVNFDKGSHFWCYSSSRGRNNRCLPPPDLHPNGVDPRAFRCLHYQRLLQLSACPAFFRHPRDPSHCPVVEPLQDLEHLPGHHLYLTNVQEYQLCHRLIHHSPGPHRCCRPLQHPCCHSLPPPRFPQVW